MSRSPASARIVRSWAVISAACRSLRSGRPNAAWFSAVVASSARARPSSVMLARTTRRSAGESWRWTRPRSSSFLIALVTEAGWTMRRSPIFPIGSEPRREKASSRSAS
jgi:hypothetical protein